MAWTLGIKCITSNTHCAAACHLLVTLLHYDCVPEQAQSDALHLIAASNSLQAPALLCDASLVLWSDLINAKCSKGGETGGDKFRQSFVNWILTKWNPSEWLHTLWKIAANSRQQTWRVEIMLRIYPKT